MPQEAISKENTRFSLNLLSAAERRGTPGEGFLYQESAVGRVA